MAYIYTVKGGDLWPVALLQTGGDTTARGSRSFLPASGLQPGAAGHGGERG